MTSVQVNFYRLQSMDLYSAFDRDNSIDVVNNSRLVLLPGNIKSYVCMHMRMCMYVCVWLFNRICHGWYVTNVGIYYAN